jgi:very-short-patch-repair endonuclease
MLKGTFVEIARKLRREMTPAECILWKELRARRFRGLKLRRQAPLGEYIVDFLSMPLRLIIEVDGGIHDHQKEEDKAREEYLCSHGFTILRIRNENIYADLPEVLMQIEKEIFKTGEQIEKS